MCVCSIRCQRSLSGQRGVDAVGISASMEGGTEVDDSRPDVRSHQFSFWGATCGIGYRRRDFEISLRLVAFCWMHPFNSIFIFWFVCIASLRGFVSCQGKSAGFQAKAMWRRSGMWFGPCHGAIPRETCALLWRCASENDLFCSFAWHCLCAWMRSSLVLHLTVSAKIAFGMRGRCLKKVARSSNSKQTSPMNSKVRVEPMQQTLWWWANASELRQITTKKKAPKHKAKWDWDSQSQKVVPCRCDFPVFQGLVNVLWSKHQRRAARRAKRWDSQTTAGRVLFSTGLGTPGLFCNWIYCACHITKAGIFQLEFSLL